MPPSPGAPAPCTPWKQISTTPWDLPHCPHAASWTDFRKVFRLGAPIVSVSWRVYGQSGDANLRERIPPHLFAGGVFTPYRQAEAALTVCRETSGKGSRFSKDPVLHRNFCGPSTLWNYRRSWKAKRKLETKFCLALHLIVVIYIPHFSTKNKVYDVYHIS